MPKSVKLVFPVHDENWARVSIIKEKLLGAKFFDEKYRARVGSNY